MMKEHQSCAAAVTAVVLMQAIFAPPSALAFLPSSRFRAIASANSPAYGTSTTTPSSSSWLTLSSSSSSSSLSLLGLNAAFSSSWNEGSQRRNRRRVSLLKSNADSTSSGDDGSLRYSSHSMSPVDDTTATTSTNDVSDDDDDKEVENKQLKQNRKYILGLLDNLASALDKWIMTGSLATRMRAYNIMKQIEREAMDDELAQQASRMAIRAGMPLEEPPPLPPSVHIPPPTTTTTSSSLNINADAEKRKAEAEARKQWESKFKDSDDSVGGPGVAKGVKERVGRSALSNRAATSTKPDIFMPDVGKDPARFAKDKKDFETALHGGGADQTTLSSDDSTKSCIASAAERTAELVAKAGAGSAFEGETLGIGGLDDVLAQVKRRIWVPLAAPPSLLKELGINPVRGLLLYGMPGCGKTLLARSLGKILSPIRPITVVSGPEIMDKFVGSSEKNLREIFDNPPDIYDNYRIGTDDNGEALSKAALHVIVFDEFDAMARTRGGSGGKGDQGDAGVARDSVVNQMLAKMDGVDPLVVPTLVIGLTNKRTLVEPALLRPGRFEVQIEVPPPRTVAQRISILKVHMNNMFRAGRVLVRDAPEGTAAARRLELTGSGGVLSYSELLDLLAVECDGMSGASLAGVARAAASRALERAVCDFAGSFADREGNILPGASIADCLVTQEDFEKAVEDVFESSRGGDGGEETPAEESVADDAERSGEQDSAEKG